MTHVIHVTDDSFQTDVLNSPVPVLVDFWAEWCAPCKQIAPVLDALAADFEGVLVMAKLDIDNNPEMPRKYAVRGIPTLLFFKNGELAATHIGALPKSRLADWIKSNL